jgi:hypothetical protein
MLGMVKQNVSKLNLLERELPEGLLVTAKWMSEHGYSTALRTHYVAAGWLEQPVRGVFRRPRGSVGWQQVVISLQMIMKLPLVVGGRTALELWGFSHYLIRTTTEIHLYSPKPPPGWLTRLPLEASFVAHNSLRLFPASGSMKDEFSMSPWGQWDWQIVLSTPERAVLELLDELPARESFHQVDKLFEGLSSVSPRRLQPLLEACRSVKVKRLFFFFADRHRHAWLKHLDKRAIDFGAGKRQLVEGGVLDPSYQITVPKDLDDVQ